MAEIIVLFEVTIREGKQSDYMEHAAVLKTLLEEADGFMGAERFSSLAVEGKLLSKSHWRDEACVSKWRNRMEHRMSQKHGRMHDFVDYKITVVTPVRCYTMASRDGAPADSNEYFKV